MLSPYWQSFPALRAVHLESSPVESIQRTARSLTIDLDVVLTPAHPNYRIPLHGPDHDHRPAQMTLTGDRVQLAYREGPSPRSAPAEPKLGSIDSWTVDGDGWSLLESERWSARMLCHSVHLMLRP